MPIWYDTKMDEIEILYEYYLNPERASMFGAEVKNAMNEFIGNTVPLPFAAFPHFSDWFIFDFQLSGGLTPARRFSETSLRPMTNEDRAVYKEIAEHNVFDFFEVSDVKKRTAVFTSVRDQKRYRVVFPKRAAMDNRDIVVCRIVQAYGEWHIASTDAIGMPSPSARDKRRMAREFPVLDPRVVYHEIVAPQGVMENTGMTGVSVEDFGNGITLASGGDHTEDDNCPVCQAVRFTKTRGRAPTAEELDRAFKKANGKQSD